MPLDWMSSSLAEETLEWIVLELHSDRYISQLLHEVDRLSWLTHKSRIPSELRVEMCRNRCYKSAGKLITAATEARERVGSVLNAENKESVPSISSVTYGFE